MKPRFVGKFLLFQASFELGRENLSVVFEKHNALFLCGFAFIFNLASLYLGYFSPGGLEPTMTVLTILLMVGGISCFYLETVL